MLKDYKEQCENFVKMWIRKNTRYKSKDIVLENYKDFIVDLEVEVSNELEIVPFKANVGKNINSVDKILSQYKIQANFEDEKYFSKAEYELAVERQIKNNYESKENLECLFDMIKSGGYAIFTKDNDFVFQLGKTRLIYKFECPICMGKGNIKCDYCKNGKVKCSSWGCDNGRKRKTQTVGGIKRKFYEDCDSCKGTGFKICSICRGSSRVSCNSCDASGTQTEIQLFFCKTKPSYKILHTNDIDETLKQGIDNFGAENFNVIADIARTSIKILHSNKLVLEHYKIKVPFAQFSTTLKDKQYDWIIYGKNLQMLENGNIPVKSKIVTVLLAIIVLCIGALVFWFFYVNQTHLIGQENNETKIEFNETKATN